MSTQRKVKYVKTRPFPTHLLTVLRDDELFQKSYCEWQATARCNHLNRANFDFGA